MKIKINAQIISGNIGKNWTDNNAVADELADFTKKTWENDLLKYADAEIQINIDVQHNCSESCRSIDVITSDDAVEIESQLTDQSRIFDLFCSSEIAKKYTT